MTAQYITQQEEKGRLNFSIFYFTSINIMYISTGLLKKAS